MEAAVWLLPFKPNVLSLNDLTIKLKRPLDLYGHVDEEYLVISFSDKLPKLWLHKSAPSTKHYEKTCNINRVDSKTLADVTLLIETYVARSHNGFFRQKRM